MPEVEVKFEIPEGGSLDDFTRACAAVGLELGPPETVEVVDTYYDSPDLRLRAQGRALRLRVSGHRRILGWKSLTPADPDGISTREEEEFEMPEGTPPSLDPDLKPNFVVRQNRTRWQVQTGDGLRAEASWDTVTWEAKVGESADRVLELELKDGNPEHFRKVALGLGETLGWPTATWSKYERGLALAGLELGPG